VCLDLSIPINTDFIEDGAFEFIFDKGCLDCILCNSNALKLAKTFMSNIYRFLAPGGIYVSISYGTPETREGLFSKF